MSKISELISMTSPVQVSTTVSCGCKDLSDTPDYDDDSTVINQEIDDDSTVINQEIDRPRHYASKSGRDVIDWCEDFGLMDNAYIFNIFKYLCRAGKKSKNSVLQDALKARIYLDRFIENLQK